MYLPRENASRVGNWICTHMITRRRSLHIHLDLLKTEAIIRSYIRVPRVYTYIPTIDSDAKNHSLTRMGKTKNRGIGEPAVDSMKWLYKRNRHGSAHNVRYLYSFLFKGLALSKVLLRYRNDAVLRHRFHTFSFLFLFSTKIVKTADSAQPLYIGFANSHKLCCSER